MNRLQQRIAFFSLFAALLTFVACSDDDEDNGSELTDENETGTQSGGGGEPTLANVDVNLDLVELSHLADVDHGGLYMDFGTPGRHKYTSGNWNTGWGADRIIDGHSVSRFGTLGRIYFPVAEPEDLTLRVTLKSVGSNQLIAFMNNNNLGTFRVENGDFQTLEINVSADKLRAGENYLLFRSTETTQVEGDGVSFEVDSIWVRSSGATDAQAPPPITGRETVGTETRDGLALDAPTTLNWYIDVPENAKLILGHGHVSDGEASIKVFVTPEGGSRRELLDFAVEPSWGQTEVDLSPVAGDVVRLEVQALGNGRIALSRAVVVTPHVELRAENEMRNVIVLTIDTLPAYKLRPYNPDSRVQTPIFDAFANGGANFMTAQSPENWTKPSVASILTSLFPMTHGAKSDASTLPASVLTVEEHLQANGFATGSFVANGYVSRAFGFDQGWDHHVNYIRENKVTEAENVFGEAATWIEENKDGRFFAYIQTIDPHVPYDPPDEFLHMYDARTGYEGRVQNRQTHLLLEEAKQSSSPATFFDASERRRLEGLYDGEVSYHDRYFGEFLERLSELGLADNTIIVVTSDHGEEFNQHGSWGHGHSIYQELLNVPLAFRWPGVTDGGRRIPEVVSTMDIAPTVLDALGVEVPEEFEGQSLSDYLRGGRRSGPAVAFSDYQDIRRVITGGGWKFLIRGNLTYAMFNLEEDPLERNEINDPSAHPIAMRYLRILLGQMLGAPNRSEWIHGSGEAVEHVQEETMTEELCRQLVALGYMDCLDDFPGAR